MPRQRHHTSKPESLQLQALEASSWEQEVVPTLPKELESQAKAKTALVRHRQISLASDLLRALLAYVLCVSSFRQSSLLGDADRLS